VAWPPAWWGEAAAAGLPVRAADSSQALGDHEVFPPQRGNPPLQQ